MMNLLYQISRLSDVIGTISLEGHEVDFFPDVYVKRTPGTGRDGSPEGFYRSSAAALFFLVPHFRPQATTLAAAARSPAGPLVVYVASCSFRFSSWLMRWPIKKSPVN